MTYPAHLQAVTSVFKKCGIRSKAKTHAARRGGAQFADLMNVSEMQIRLAGRWNMSVMEKTYLSHLPRNFMRAQAQFDEKGGHFFINRGLITPPQSLAQLIFPEADEWIRRHEEREGVEEDMAAGGFLTLLIQMRTILLQDAVVLKQNFPDHVLLQHTIFRSQNFVDYENEVLQSLGTEDPTNPTLRQVVPEVAAAIAGVQTFLKEKIDGLAKANIDIMGKLTEDSGKILTILRNFGSSVADVLNPSNTSSPSHIGESSQAATPPASNITSTSSYTMSRSIGDVRSLVEEWTQGLSGLPSIMELDNNFGSKWRSAAKERRHYCDRKIIMNEYLRLIQEMTQEQAIQILERKRAGAGLHTLTVKLRDEKKSSSSTATGESQAQNNVSSNATSRRR